MSNDQDQNSINFREEFSWRTHSYLNEQIRFADAKAGFVGATTIALIGALYSAGVHHGFVATRAADWSLESWLSVGSFLGLFISIGACILAVMPRTWKHHEQGYFFWGAIAKHEAYEVFSQKTRDSKREDLNEHLSHHLYSLAKICNAKYRLISIALVWGTLGGFVGGVVMLWYGPSK